MISTAYRKTLISALFISVQRYESQGPNLGSNPTPAEPQPMIVVGSQHSIAHVPDQIYTLSRSAHREIRN